MNAIALTSPNGRFSILLEARDDGASIVLAGDGEEVEVAVGGHEDGAVVAVRGDGRKAEAALFTGGDFHRKEGRLRLNGNLSYKRGREFTADELP